MLALYTGVATPTVDCTTGGLRYQKFQLTGFSATGAGQLIGPDGNEMDTEDFLASLTVTLLIHGTAAGSIVLVCMYNLLFLPLVQQYLSELLLRNMERQIVNYSLDNICDADGTII